MSAKFIKQTTVKMVEVKTEIDMIELIITPEEALTLYLILCSVGGDPRNTLRGHADSVRRKLAEVGANPPHHNSVWKEGMPCLYFSEESLQLLKYAPKPKDCGG